MKIASHRLGGSAAVTGGNDSGGRENLFAVRAPHRVDRQRQAAADGGTGAPVVGRDRSASVDSGLRRAGGRSRRGSKRGGGRPPVGLLRSGQYRQGEFRQGILACRGPSAAEFIYSGSGDAQARQEDGRSSGAGEREKVWGVAAGAQRGGERQQRLGTSRAESVFGRGAGGLSPLCGFWGFGVQFAPDRAGVVGATTSARSNRAGGGLTVEA